MYDFPHRNSAVSHIKSSQRLDCKTGWLITTLTVFKGTTSVKFYPVLKSLLDFEAVTANWDPGRILHYGRAELRVSDHRLVWFIQNYICCLVWSSG